MRLFLMHIDDGPAPRDPDEEATLIVPGAPGRTAIAVPLGALERFLPALAEATEGIEQSCGTCGEPLAAMPPRWLGRA